MLFKLRKLQILALLIFIGAGCSWFFSDKYHRDLYPYGYSQNLSRLEPTKPTLITEKDAWDILGNAKIEMARLQREQKLDTWAIQSILDRLDVAFYNYGNAKDRDQEFTSENYTFGDVRDSIQTLKVELENTRSPYCASEAGRDVCIALSKERYESGRLHLVESPSPERLGMLRYKIGRLLLIALLGLLILAIDSGRQSRWIFERMIGQRVMKFSAQTVMFFFTMSGGTAIAQQMMKKIEKDGQKIEEITEKDQGTVNTKPISINATFFSDTDRDRQAFFLVKYKRWIGFIQNRETTDRKSYTTTFAGGMELPIPGKSFGASIFGGPAMNWKTGQYAGNFQVLTTFFLKTRYFEGSGLVKNIIATDSAKSVSGSRHIQTIRGPTVGTPRWLQGFAVHAENWHVSGPNGAHWIEAMFGFDINLGGILGKPKSWLGDFTLYSYQDLCRPQPGHPQKRDIRFQWSHTFKTTFAH